MENEQLHNAIESFKAGFPFEECAKQSGICTAAFKVELIHRAVPLFQSSDELRPAARLAIIECGHLGFDSVAEALFYLLNHDDWGDRWEFDTDSQRAAIRCWRRARIQECKERKEVQ